MNAVTRNRRAILCFILLVCASAASEANEIRFIENAQQRGIDFVQTNGSPQKDYIVEAKGAGVAIADVNHDGWDDIYFVNGALLQPTSNQRPKNTLYLNNGDGTFRDATASSGLGDAGFGCGAYFADVDNDGDLDCYLTNFGPNQLYLNNGDGTFVRQDNAGGAQNNGWSTGAAFADLNHDGYLDLFVGQYAEFSVTLADKKGKLAPYRGEMMFIGPSGYVPANDNLFFNNGDGTFRDVTRQWGVNEFGAGRAFTSIFSDLDDDGDLDLYVSNDTTTNLLYENTGARFEEISILAGAGLSESGDEQGGMGLAIRDVNGNGRFDLAIANYQDEYNILYENQGGLQFADAAFSSGIGTGTRDLVSFGMLLEDFDNDGWPDMHISCGHVYPKADTIKHLFGYAQANLFFHNQGGGRFSEITQQTGPASTLTGVSRGSAAADFDHDGDLDIVINNLDGRPFFFENQSECGNWIQVALQDKRGMPAYGAKILIETEGREQVAELYSSASFLSQSSATLHIGLGESLIIDRMTVRWPDGTQEKKEHISTNQILIWKQSDDKP
ncbi:MAG: CRTAC1 family protein [Candidatus Hinthialibacter antarcticus]|nr:CRTAC1 family protein [Candidatus Hinthialibacter antarcticus]